MPVLVTDPLGSSADKDRIAGPARPRRAWQVWRSPDDQPRWARPALLGVAVVAAVLYAWNITQAGYAPFYSVAVKSMSESWKAFFYGAFDPNATVTIDKLAGSFLPQALSARIFGFSAWSLALPQVIEGVVSVLVMYRVVRRWKGVPAGLVAAGIFTLTPIAASMFGHSMEDGALTMCLVLAADAYQRAVTEARLRSLVLAGVWVGLGFQAKMMQAWMVLPALAIGYLLASPARRLRRLWHVGVAGAVMLAVSLSWIALYTFTPAHDRPYIDGSTNNSAVAMVFGYNGLERFGIKVNGAVTSGPGVTTGGAGGSGAAGGAGAGRPGAAAIPAGGKAGQQAGGSAPAGGFPGGAPSGSGSFGGAPAGASGGAPSAGQAPGGGLPGGTSSQGGTSAAGGKAGAGSGKAGTGTGASGTSGRGAFPGFSGGAAPGGSGSAGGSSFGSGWTKLLGSEYGPEIGWLYPLAALSFVFGLAWTRRAKRTDPERAGFVMWGTWLATYGLIFSKMSTIPHTAYMSSLAPALAALSAAGIVMFWRAYRAGGWRAWLLPAAVAAELAWALFLWHYYPGFLPWARDAMAVAGVAAIVLLVAARFFRRIWGRLVTVALVGGVAAMIAAPGAWAASVLDTSYAGSSFNASAGPAGGFGGGSAPGGGGGSGSPGGSGGGISSTATTTLTTAEQKVYDYVSSHRDGASYLMAVGSWEEAGQYILATGQGVMDMGGFSGSVPSPTLDQVKNLVHAGQLKFFLISSSSSGSGSGGSFGAGGPGSGGAGGSTSTAIDSWVASSCAKVPAADYTASTASGGGTSGVLYACSTHA